MSGQLDCLRALSRGPLTNAGLQYLTCDHGGGVARTMAKLIQSGRVRRIDGGRGRGTIAIYALLTPTCNDSLPVAEQEESNDG